MRMYTPSTTAPNRLTFKENPDRPRCKPADVLREVIEANRQMVLNRESCLQAAGRQSISFMLVNESDLFSQSRHGDVVRVRQVYAALARRFTDASWPEIAKAMNRVKHTSALTASKAMHRKFEHDPELRAIYAAACLMLAARNLIGVEVKDGVETGEVARWRQWASGGAA